MNRTPSGAYMVIFWDGSRQPADDRLAAVLAVQSGLAAWSNPTDRIVWRMDEGDALPMFAEVVDEYGERTDACAVLKLVA